MRTKRAGVISWLNGPGGKPLAVCPGCGLDVTTIGLNHLAYTFEVKGDFLAEQLWHRICLAETILEPATTTKESTTS